MYLTGFNSARFDIQLLRKEIFKYFPTINIVGGMSNMCYA